MTWGPTMTPWERVKDRFEEIRLQGICQPSNILAEALLACAAGLVRANATTLRQTVRHAEILHGTAAGPRELPPFENVQE